MQRSFLITGLAIYFAFLMNLFGEVRVGDTAEYAEQEMGAPTSRSSLGVYEVFQYKNGTKITFKDGIVTDIVVRGGIQIGTMTKVVETAKPLKSALTATNSVRTNKVPVTQVAKTETIQTNAIAKVEPPAITNNTKATKPASVTYTASPLPPIAVSGLPGNTKNFPKLSTAVLGGVIIVSLVLTLVFHIFFSWCFKLICLKTGYDPGVMVWIPIAQCIPLLRVAKMPELTLLLLLIPFVNCVFILIMFAKICTARTQTPWLAATLLLPGVNLFLIPYLAFIPANPGLVQEESAPDSPPTNNPDENQYYEDDNQGYGQANPGETSDGRIVLS